MKKFGFFVMLGMVCSFFSCGNRTDGDIAYEDSLKYDTIEVINSEQDPVQLVLDALKQALEEGDVQAINTNIQTVEMEFKTFMEAGDSVQCEVFATAISDFMHDNSERLSALKIDFQTLTDMVVALTGETKSMENDGKSDAE